MEQGEKETWRFWDKQAKRIEYGIGEDPHRYGDSNFLAMRHIKSADERGEELFNGDIVTSPSFQDEFLYATSSGDLEMSDGQPIQLDNLSSYALIGQAPMRGLDK